MYIYICIYTYRVNPLGMHLCQLCRQVVEQHVLHFDGVRVALSGFSRCRCNSLTQGFGSLGKKMNTQKNGCRKSKRVATERGVRDFFFCSG